MQLARSSNDSIVYQNLVKEFVLGHLKEEKETGAEIYPAFAVSSIIGDEGHEADKSNFNHSFIVTSFENKEGC